MNRTNPQEWISFLKTASPTSSKFSLSQIVDISQTKLREAQESYLRHDIKETELINLTNDIADQTIQSITSWNSKRDHPFLRRIAALSSFGIPFLSKLQQEDGELNAQRDQFIQVIVQANKANFQALLLKKLENLPVLLEEIKKRYTDHRRQELVHDQILADWQEFEDTPLELRPPYDAEFEREIKRGSSFLRIDKAMKIEDHAPIPSLHLEGDQRVREAAASLQALLKPADQHWMQVLQLAATHACFNTAFKAVLSAINIELAKVQWESKGIYYSVKSIFSDRFPPIILALIRHHKTGTIEKVDVTVKGGLDIVSYHAEGNEERKTLFADILSEELKYSISFGEDHRPVVSDLHSEMKTHVSFRLIQKVSLN